MAMAGAHGHGQGRAMGALPERSQPAHRPCERPDERLFCARDAKNLLKLSPKGEGFTPPNWRQ
jgi:hypothetical protein